MTTIPRTATTRSRSGSGSSYATSTPSSLGRGINWAQATQSNVAPHRLRHKDGVAARASDSPEQSTGNSAVSPSAPSQGAGGGRGADVVGVEQAAADLQAGDNFLRWSEAAQQRFYTEFRAVAASKPEATVTGSKARVLQLVPAEGMRVTDLARQAKVTKQALGQVVRTLETQGLVSIDRDADDARVRWVRCTPAGERARTALGSSITEAQDTVRDAVGPERFDQMLQTLRDIAEGDF